MPTVAYLSLGSNIGNRREYLHDAIARLSKVGQMVAVSSLYETEPVDFTDQAWFLNCAVAIQTTDTPDALMNAVLQIERKIGRVRTAPKGPRTIDIDVLLYDALIIDTPELTVPHPVMHQRRFVLEPLAEIAPGAVHPILNKTVTELLDALPGGPRVREYKDR
jgi:2-amino-4-hydroxy-6-hydroxymethyldihydropteridine diphosphokinase